MRSDRADSSAASPDSRDDFERALRDVMERVQQVISDGPYDAEWESLGDHNEAPEWFRDAKFGIYCHWGPYSVPAFKNAWYGNQMYTPGEDTHEYHIDNYGEPDEVPYQDFVEDFTAENFDAEAWADLFEEVGARFAGPIAEHHDGWSNWDSGVNPWNAGDRGPKRDIVGELESEIRDRDMRFVTTFHHERTREYYANARVIYPSVMEGYPDEVMYGDIDEDLYFDHWVARLVEVIDDYEPDLIWHDGALEYIDDSHHRQYLAYYFNRAAKRDQDVVVTSKREQYPLDVSVEDFERGRTSQIRDRPWLTDTSVDAFNWMYNPDSDLKTSRELVHELIDIVSKNGCLLLNFGPRADGTIPEEQTEILRGIGEWLDTHGEAIFETRPWKTFGEGPTNLGDGGHHVDDVVYSRADVRYTQSKEADTLYATVMGWPDRETVTLKSVDLDSTDHGTVGLLGGPDDLEYEITDDGHLSIAVPDLDREERPSDIAVVFEVTGFDIEYRAENE